MTELHKSSSHVQMLAEDIIFQEVEKILDTKWVNHFFRGIDVTTL